MATRSTIAVKLNDGKFKQVYCHWDGYVEGGVGETLCKHYNTQELAELVVSGGSISSLAENFSTTLPHSFDAPCENVTVLYHRDRREDLNIDTYDNEEMLRLNGQEEQYNYVWKDGTWYVAGKKLSDLLQGCDEEYED